jgi:large subunit ribosomal protein L10
MLSRKDKQAIIDGLKVDFDKASGFFLTNLVGITANDAVQVRKDVREKGGKIVVTRNTLFRMAAKGTKCEELFSQLKGTNAVAFAFADSAAVVKVLRDAGKDKEQVTLKGGFLGDTALSIAQVKELASLPSREQMLGTTLATMMAPCSSFVRLLVAIKEQKEAGAVTA